MKYHTKLGRYSSNDMGKLGNVGALAFWMGTWLIPKKHASSAHLLPHQIWSF